MNQLELSKEYDSIDYMVQYSKDQVPMDPLVARFLMSNPSMETIYELQEWIAENMPEYEGPVAEHCFSDGIYSRSLDIPAGILAIGHTHAKGHLTMLVKGDLTIISRNGTERVKAPRIWADDPGIKRCVYAHSDSTIVTVHGTHCTDLKELEQELTIPETLGQLAGDTP